MPPSLPSQSKAVGVRSISVAVFSQTQCTCYDFSGRKNRSKGGISQWLKGLLFDQSLHSLPKLCISVFLCKFAAYALQSAAVHVCELADETFAVPLMCMHCDDPACVACMPYWRVAQKYQRHGIVGSEKVHSMWTLCSLMRFRQYTSGSAPQAHGKMRSLRREP